LKKASRETQRVGEIIQGRGAWDSEKKTMRKKVEEGEKKTRFVVGDGPRKKRLPKSLERRVRGFEKNGRFRRP